MSEPMPSQPESNPPPDLALQITVLLIDDNPIFLRSLERLVARDPALNIVGSFTSPRAGLDAARELHPDVALVDLRMPELNGYDLIPLLCAQVPTCIVIAISLADEPHVARTALQRGAQAFILKDQMVAELSPQIHKLYEARLRDLPGNTPNSKDTDTMANSSQDEQKGLQDQTLEQLELSKKAIENAQDDLQQAHDALQDTQDALRQLKDQPSDKSQDSN